MENKTRKILVVDDNGDFLDRLKQEFGYLKEDDFPKLSISDDVRKMLHSMELETIHNMADLGEALEKLHLAHKTEAYSGIISDFDMPTSFAHKRSLRTPETPHPNSLPFSQNENAVPQCGDGGLQLAKVAKIVGIPLVMLTGAPAAAEYDLGTKHLKGMKPVGKDGLVGVYGKGDFEKALVGLAEAILENEKKQAVSR